MSSVPAVELTELALSPAAHAALELRRVGLRLCQLLDAWLRARGEPDPALVQSLGDCRAQLALLTGPLPTVDDAGSVDDELDRLERHLDGRLSATRSVGRPTPLMLLARDGGLGEFELELLLLAALPEESALWGSLFAFLAGSDSVRRPTVHHALNLWSAPGQRRAMVRQLVEGPLLGYQLLRLEPADAPLADRTLCLAAETWHALCGLDAIDAQLASSLVAALPMLSARPILPPALATQVDELAARARAGQAVRAVLLGPHGSGRRTVARHVAGQPLVELQLPAGEPSPAWCAAAVRHALARGAGLLLTTGLAPGESVFLPLRLPPRMSCFVVLPEKTDVRGDALAAALRLHLPLPTVRERQELWQAALAGRECGALDAGELARRYRLSGGEILGTIEIAGQLARLEHREDTTLGDVARSVRERPSLRLESLARRRRPKAGWDDLVAPAPVAAQLRELSGRVHNRDLVFDEWNVVGHTARQTGVLALFVGPSGTGKTLAAEVIAGQLELDLYCVDLSQVVSKYIGETEKNLSRVFDAVEGTAAVLFFDEADGLFGKRTETHDAHDRYANLEVSYLLARLETFSGVAVLASNFRNNIDHAFLRRMDFVIEFSQPDIGARRRLWEQHLRCNAPQAGDIEPSKLAELFPVSGAHIRNAVVGGAFGAAAAGAPLGFAHLVAAMRREYEKVGKAFPSIPFTSEEKKPWP